MERKKKKERSGFYIALCSCAVIVAIAGYASRMSLTEDNSESDIAKAIETPAPMPLKTAQEDATSKANEPASEGTTAPDSPVSTNTEVEEEIHFSAPVSGKVIEEFSGDDLVYHEALKDWRAHSGVDFEAEIGEKVIACAAGIVESVFDSSLGRCVIIDHENGYKTMYANLNEDTQVSEGDKLLSGDTIGTVGNTALGDNTDLPHLHFEMTVDGETVNPTEYLE